jgi:hypothetical protein
MQENEELTWKNSKENDVEEAWRWKSWHRSVCTVLGLSSAAEEGSLVGQPARSRACPKDMITDELLQITREQLVPDGLYGRRTKVCICDIDLMYDSSIYGYRGFFHNARPGQPDSTLPT